MHPLRSFLFSFACATLFITCSSPRKAQNPLDIPPKDPRWTQVDSLSEQGLYASALERTSTILSEAHAGSEWRTEFRAWMYRGRLEGLLGRTTDSTLVEIEERARTSPFPLQQLLHSVAAEAWWSRYQMDRWRILERTNMQEDGDDPATWTQASFVRKVINEFRASLAPRDSLLRIAVGDLGDLLVSNERDLALRPSLFDILAHRALAVFKNSETRITEPTWRFTLDDPGYFKLFEPFAFGRIDHRDSSSWEYQALGLYRSLERSHLNDVSPDALVDVTLERLRYVREHSTLPEKDSLYLNALEELQGRLVRDSAWAEVTLAIAEVHIEFGANYERLAGDAWKWELRTARMLCDSAIIRYPGSFGAMNAMAVKSQLERSSLDIHVEEAVGAGRKSTVALGYTNSKRVWFRVVKDPVVVNEGRQEHGDRTEWLLAQRPVMEWDVDLKDDGDLQRHVIELPVPALAHGHYTIISSGSDRFDKGKGPILHAPFWVTDVAVSERSDGRDIDLLVLDRWSGSAREEATVHTYFRSNNYSREREFTKLVETITDSDGRAKINIAGGRGVLVHVVQKGKDRYQTGANWFNEQRGGEQQEQIRTFLFTDRAIYRPGQEIFFKGIVITELGHANSVKAGHSAIVRLYDVNGQQVDTLGVVSDAFGAYHGKFVAPLGVLTGSMRIDAGSGSRSIQLEEYKRPAFEVVFDPVGSMAKLDQEAVITGVAKSYAGVPLDDAKVQWTVEREASMPWWCGWNWWRLPWGRSTEIASGDAECDEEGRFMIKFIAAADKVFPRKSDPNFHFTIEASATDLNGETQSASTTLNAAHRSIQIELGAMETIDRNVVDSLEVRVVNLNGQAVDVPMDVRVVELLPPIDAPQRERLWERPDLAFEGELPTTHLPNDPKSWPEKKEHMKVLGHRALGGSLLANGIEDWTVGMYRIEVNAIDPDGELVSVSKLFTVYDTQIQNSGFVNEAFHVEPVVVTCEPDGKAVLLLSSALSECRVLMEVERDGVIVISRPFLLSSEQQRIDIPVLESDRGGFAVHFLCVERGRVHAVTQMIDVPWTNKELKVEWLSFRDKLQPGSKEEWRLRITGPNKEKVAAQLLGVMYDASLDHFVPHSWQMFQWPKEYARRHRNKNEPFGANQGQGIHGRQDLPSRVGRSYPELDLEGYLQFNYRAGGRYDAMMMDRVGNAEMAFAPMQKGMIATDDMDEADPEEGSKDGGDNIPGTGSTPQPVRSDFRETAFFFPDLLTDRDGSVVLRFTSPDALTRWKIMGLAHTKDLKLVQFSKEAVSSKPLMVVPNLPRFFREGDRMNVTAKVNVMEGIGTEGTATLALFDPISNIDITQRFGVVGADQPFAAGPGSSANVAWTITVPSGVSMVSVRITATGGGMGDGEERPLPVLSDKVLVTESMPIAITRSGTKTFRLEKLVASKSVTLRHTGLKFEFTPNPAWYAVQALPYLMEFPHECAEQVFSRYYANRLATHIVEERPAVKQVFEQWKRDAGEGDAGAFLSALEKNAELKNVLLEETPWVMTAKDDGERKRRIALFFDLQRMATEEATALRKLREMQLPNGAWSWWSGMRESRYITQHIVSGLGHLETLKAADLRPDGQSSRMLQNAVQWLDAEVAKDHQELVRRSTKENLEKHVPTGLEIQFLYARSFFPRWPITGATRTAVDYYLQRAKATWLQRSLQEQAMLALAFARLNDGEAADLVMRSLSERATRSEELGMYWKARNGGVEWWNFPTETHALMIEAFHEVAKDKASVNALRQYLLKLKQTTDWKTTKATSEACYALLLTGDDLLAPKADPVITIGGQRVDPSGQEAGTGYFVQGWTGDQVKPAMGEVSITTKEDGVQWGALHWQYTELMDKVTPHESPFKITKKVMLKDRSGAGAELVALDKARNLMAGDLLTIRIELKTDRFVDFVHMKDMRAAGLEPIEAISGYRWQGGLGYYQSIRDAGMHFFFDRIAPGTYVFEYDLRVTHSGDFSNGVTTAMCMYAPEFSSHSEGRRISVK